MSFGAILTVVIDGMHDTERPESRLVKGNRSIEIFDGYEDVVEQEFTSGIPTFPGPISSECHYYLRDTTLIPKISATPSGPSPEPGQRAAWANSWIGTGKDQM